MLAQMAGASGPLPARGCTEQSHGDSSWIFDIPIDLGRPEDLLRRITGWARRPARRGAPPKRVMYANAHVLNQSAAQRRAARRARARPTSSTATATACGWPPRRSRRRSRTA